MELLRSQDVWNAVAIPRSDDVCIRPGSDDQEPGAPRGRHMRLFHVVGVPMGRLRTRVGDGTERREGDTVG